MATAVFQTTPQTQAITMFPSSLHDPTTEEAPGQLLEELERRQDDVLAQLDDLDAKIKDVLRGLNVEIEEEPLD